MMTRIIDKIIMFILVAMLSINVVGIMVSFAADEPATATAEWVTPTVQDAYERLGIDAEDVVSILMGGATEDWQNVIQRNTANVNMNMLLATLHMTDGDNWDKVTIEGIRSALYDSELPLLPKDEVDQMTNSQAISRYLSLMIEYNANQDDYTE